MSAIFSLIALVPLSFSSVVTVTSLQVFFTFYTESEIVCFGVPTCFFLCEVSFLSSLSRY